ncbi:hypothetical protein [Flagellimonas sp. 2504JD1-5]
MDKNQEKELMDFVDKVMRETPAESPSPNFTDQVMLKIAHEAELQATSYRPLIPTNVLVAIGVALIIVLGYAVGFYKGEGGGWFAHEAISSVFTKFQGWGELLPFSRTSLYAIVLFGILFFIQIPLLKRYLDRNWMVH